MLGTSILSLSESETIGKYRKNEITEMRYLKMTVYPRMKSQDKYMYAGGSPFKFLCFSCLSD